MISVATVLAILGATLPLIGAVISAAVKIARAYGREEGALARYQNAVDELRQTQARMGGRLQRLERDEGRRVTGRHTIPGGGNGG